MSVQLGLLAGDVGLELGDRLHEDVVGDDIHSAPRRRVR